MKTEKNILVEFIDDFHYVTRTRWSQFESGNLKNPYRKSVYNIGVPGAKYQITDENNEYILVNYYTTN